MTAGFTISFQKGGVQLLGVDIAQEENVTHFNAALDGQLAAFGGLGRREPRCAGLP